MKKIILFLSFLAFTTFLFGKNASTTSVDSTNLPKAFLLGEYTAAYEKVQKTRSISLFEYCNNDTDQAFDRWARFLIAMEMYAESINYDIKGIKMFMEVCWETDGKIKYIAYAPKGDSRNVATAELTGFMKSFSKNYAPQFQPGKTVLQNTQVAFPFLNR
jgi:hypothetical protein